MKMHDLKVQRNRKNSRYIMLNGKRTFLKDACEQYKIDYSIVASRLDNGMDVEKALTTPIHSVSKGIYFYSLYVNFEGSRIPLKEACKKAGINYCSIMTRIHRYKIPIQEAFDTKIKSRSFLETRLDNAAQFATKRKSKFSGFGE